MKTNKNNKILQYLIEETECIIPDINSGNADEIRIAIKDYIDGCLSITKKGNRIKKSDMEYLEENKRDICSTLYFEPDDPQESDPPWWVDAIQDNLGAINIMISMMYNERRGKK